MVYNDNEDGDDDYDGVSILSEFINNMKEKQRKSYKEDGVERNLERK
jgi:hypothetical protein